MKFAVQAKLLAELLHWNLIDHTKVVAWVDKIIEKSSKAEPWMWEISLSDSTESKGCALLLQNVVEWQKLISLTEYIAAITYLYQRKGEPLYRCLCLLEMNHDDFLCSQNDLKCQKAKDIIVSLEARYFAEDYSENAAKEVTPPLENLAKKLQANHQDIVDFVEIFA